MDEEFAHVRKALEDVDFPASKEQLVEHTQQRGADPVAMRLLKGLPPEIYSYMSEVRRSVPLDPAADDGQTPARKAEQARSPHSRHIAEHLRE
jgi:Protein of unknown function (DUF2795)